MPNAEAYATAEVDLFDLHGPHMSAAVGAWCSRIQDPRRGTYGWLGIRGAKKLSLRVLGSNTAAIRLYERHGYVVEGRYVDELLIGGEYVDDVILGKLRRPEGPK